MVGGLFGGGLLSGGGLFGGGLLSGGGLFGGGSAAGALASAEDSVRASSRQMKKIRHTQHLPLSCMCLTAKILDARENFRASMATTQLVPLMV